MVQLNTHFKKLKREYVFPIIERKLAEAREKHPLLFTGTGDAVWALAAKYFEAYGVRNPRNVTGLKLG